MLCCWLSYIFQQLTGMLEYLDSPYFLAVGTIIGALLVLLLLTFASNGSAEDGKVSQRFVLPCMINPATLDSEDEDQQTPADDLSKVKGEVTIKRDTKAARDDGLLILEDAPEKGEGILRVRQDSEENDSCGKISPALEAEEKIKSSLTKEELLNEREIQQQQLAAIFHLMKNQTEKFGDTSMDDIEYQMKMYR